MVTTFAMRDALAPWCVTSTVSLVAIAAALVVHTATMGLLIGAIAASSSSTPVLPSGRPRSVSVAVIEPPLLDPGFDPLPDIADKQTNFVNCWRAISES